MICLHVLASTTLAAAVIGLSDLAFLAGYYGYLRLAYQTVLMSHWTPYVDPCYQATGVVIGVSLALSVASALRHTVCPPDASKTPRRWQKL